ncbi:MAG: hypothetical protein R6V41_00040 [Desulfobacteraceae bacterium]
MLNIHALKKENFVHGCDWAGSRYCRSNRTPYSNWFRKTTSSLIVTLVDE